MHGRGAGRACTIDGVLREIVDFLRPERVRELGASLGATAGGTAEEQRERLIRALAGNLDRLLPVLTRSELVDFIRMLAARSDEEEAEPPATVSQKVYLTGLRRDPALHYYLKEGAIWARPRKPGAEPRRVQACRVAMDHATYLYFVDGDGDVARARRDGKPVSATEGPLRLFIAYAREDRAHLDQLRLALRPYERNGTLLVFVDSNVEAGRPWQAEIDDALLRAEIVLLLLSNDFLDSEACMDREVPLIMQRHQRKACEVVPIVVRECRFDLTELRSLNAIKPGDLPVAAHVRPDAAWHAVTLELDPVFARVRTARR